jgi:hypothetical protein
MTRTVPDLLAEIDDLQSVIADADDIGKITRLRHVIAAREREIAVLRRKTAKPSAQRHPAYRSSAPR